MRRPTAAAGEGANRERRWSGKGSTGEIEHPRHPGKTLGIHARVIAPQLEVRMAGVARAHEMRSTT